ncbi:MAG: type II secretion system F family protein [Chloroflexi bacterium]|nr:type II secretion system F family protein [Chloroflexota bacterium]MBV9543223.1 type II secretion system F family protein [Chloroflexota bacterium]
MNGFGTIYPVAVQPSVLIWPLLFGVGLFLVLVAQPVGRPKSDLAARLRRLDVDERIRAEMLSQNPSRPIFASRWLEGLMRPVLEDVGAASRAVLSRFGISTGRELGRKLDLVRPGIQPMEFIGEKVIAGFILLVLFPVLNAMDLTLFGPWPVWVWLIGFLIGFMGPDWQLDSKVAARRTRITMELPTILDMLTIAASAGLALEQALVEVSRQSEGIVARELQRASREMALGQFSLIEALQAMADRNAVPELTGVMDNLRAVHDQGLPLAQSLAAQADALRERQRVRIVEEGGKASVRMVLPVALFILPVLFVIVLIPASVELMHLGS